MLEHAGGVGTAVEQQRVAPLRRNLVELLLLCDKVHLVRLAVVHELRLRVEHRGWQVKGLLVRGAGEVELVGLGLRVVIRLHDRAKSEIMKEFESFNKLTFEPPS